MSPRVCPRAAGVGDELAKPIYASVIARHAFTIDVAWVYANPVVAYLPGRTFAIDTKCLLAISDDGRATSRWKDGDEYDAQGPRKPIPN